MGIDRPSHIIAVRVALAAGFAVGGIDRDDTAALVVGIRIRRMARSGQSLPGADGDIAAIVGRRRPVVERDRDPGAEGGIREGSHCIQRNFQGADLSDRVVAIIIGGAADADDIVHQEAIGEP